LIMKYSDACRQQIEEVLTSIVKNRQPEGLYKPVEYILSIGGKRIRPMLCMLGCALYDKSNVDQCLYPAVGLELFHNFTLLHDDIMDASEMRRNKPTVHIKWDDRTAILSGDAMMILAYQMVTRAPAGNLPKVLELFNRTAIEVCEGQQYDMYFESRMDIRGDEYLEMIRLKTAVLLGACLQTGAIIGGASDQASEALYKFGCDAGMAFQLQDDWLDVYGDEEKFGKPIGGDIVINKKTFLLITAYNSLPEAARKELLYWLEKKDFDRQDKIDAVRNLYDEAKVSDTARLLMDQYYSRALEHLEYAGGTDEIRLELKEFAYQMMDRFR
jgi:geranylgeranyl diphosphate synthase type II